MKTIALWKKETKIGFASPIAYVLFAVFLFVAGWLFFTIVKFAAQSSMSMFGAANQSVMDEIFRPLYRNFAVILLFLTPAITMRLFAEEKRSGTIELLFTYPLTDLQILFGKFLSALSFFAFIVVPTILYAFFVNRFSKVEWGVLGIQFLGLFLLGGCYLAVGLWASIITESQIVAFVLTFGILLAFWIVGWVSQAFAASNAAQVLSQLSIVNHFDNFGKGVLDTSDLSFYIFFILFFLYMSFKVLESRSWRGSRE